MDRFELRIKRAEQPITDAWRSAAVEPRGRTALGISFRPPQVDTLGLELQPTLSRLLELPFEIIRLGAYWSRIEPAPGAFDPHELDWQVEAAARAGKRIIVCAGALKTFGYPEFFVPGHRLIRPLPERTLITPAAFGWLLDAATEFLERIVERYKHEPAIVAWQVEHEAVDPLGLEHSWRLSASFVQRELEAVRRADPSRPILMNGYLPASLPVRIAQWFQTRDQGDSVTFAQRHADIVGLDYYPRHALASLGGAKRRRRGTPTLYLDGSHSPWHRPRRTELLAWARTHARRLMVSEGQAEPWEAVTTPPNPTAARMYSCLPEQMIATYNDWLGWARQADVGLEAYLFWGAEYWMLRARSGDPGYLGAFARILERS